MGSFATYGYQKDPSNHTKLIVDELAAETVQDIFRWKISGMNNQSIADRLNAKKVPSPAARKLQSGAKLSLHFRKSDEPPWSAKAVDRILHSEVYTGKLVQGKTRRLDYRSKKKLNLAMFPSQRKTSGTALTRSCTSGWKNTVICRSWYGKALEKANSNQKK